MRTPGRDEAPQSSISVNQRALAATLAPRGTLEWVQAVLSYAAEIAPEGLEPFLKSSATQAMLKSRRLKEGDHPRDPEKTFSVSQLKDDLKLNSCHHLEILLDQTVLSFRTFHKAERIKPPRGVRNHSKLAKGLDKNDPAPNSVTRNVPRRRDH